MILQENSFDSQHMQKDNFFQKPYSVHALLFFLFIAAGVVYNIVKYSGDFVDTAGAYGGAIQNGLAATVRGLYYIFTGPDVLVRDYIYVGGFGSTLVNVGLAGLLAVVALKLARHTPSGLTMGTFGLVIGFAFFGKNIVNMMPIIVGGFLYGLIHCALVERAPFDKCVLRAVLATCLAPVITQAIHFNPALTLAEGVAVGIATGFFVGYFINPIAMHVEAAHKGYNLYNIGWAAGIVGMAIFVIFRVLGTHPEVQNDWSTGYTVHLTVLLATVSGYFIIVGVLGSLTKRALHVSVTDSQNCGAISQNSKKIRLREFFMFHKYDIDFFAQLREKTYIHMGIMGLMCLVFMLIVRGEYNGPVIGAILSVVGFGAYGKTILTAVPLMAGAMLAAVIASMEGTIGTQFNHPSFLVAAIFSTCLSPFVKKFGMGAGLAAGFLHLAFAVNIAGFHGGLNLYNNGFAGGLTVVVLLPIITILKEGKP